MTLVSLMVDIVGDYFAFGVLWLLKSILKSKIDNDAWPSNTSDKQVLVSELKCQIFFLIKKHHLKSDWTFAKSARTTLRTTLDSTSNWIQISLKFKVFLHFIWNGICNWCKKMTMIFSHLLRSTWNWRVTHLPI